LLEFLIGIIDAELFKTVHFKRLKSTIDKNMLLIKVLKDIPVQ